MDMLIAFDGRRGHTRQAAEAMARAAVAAGAEARIAHIDMTDAGDVTSADALVAGCWIKGNAPFGGVRFGRMANWIKGLPTIDGMPAGAFCTYGFFPMFFADAVAHTGEALDRLQGGLEAKGAEVVATHAIHRRSPGRGAADFVNRVLEHVGV